MTVPGFKGCTGCGNCCRVKGYVRLKPGEAEAIAGALDMALYDFTAEHTRVTDDRRTLSLTEQHDGSCVFLDGDHCTINDVKPRQCLDFPYAWRFDGWGDICEGFTKENHE